MDIHHVFPRDWCKKQGLTQAVFDSILNKTPLSHRTTRIVGGAAPSVYLAKLEQGNAANPPIPRATLVAHLRTHMIDPDLLWGDQFAEFMTDRQKRLLALIERATGKPVYGGPVAEEGEDVEEEDTVEPTNSSA